MSVPYVTTSARTPRACMDRSMAIASSVRRAAQSARMTAV
uniref:Uncharacterized protein n=1 Tax=Arundo donax TaxID=35708 RepID=A0A0A8ZZ52_ARUDO